MRNDILLKTLFCACLVCLGACRGVSYQYVDEHSGIHNKIQVPAGSSVADIEFSIVTNYALPLIESDYPTISFDYASKASAADKLKKLEIKLFVDEREIAADETIYDATHFGRTITFTEAECCENLGRKLQIGDSKADTEYPFGVRLVKKYKSLKRLPPEMTVVVSATTDKGTTETTKKLTLKAYEDGGFIRFH